jgi:ribose-phosphate pyrophosphokinase
MEQMIMIDAAKRASAKRITAVAPFYGYSRQDRKAEGREPITARLVADMCTTAGADRVVTVDLHTGQIQGFFDFPVDHLTAVPVLVDYLARELPSGPITVVAPDAGGGKLARRFADRLNAEIAFIDKRRPKGTHNVAVATEVVGEIEGRTCVIVDDIIDTASTVVSAADLLLDRGASEVLIAATHGLLSGPAVDRLKNSRVREVVVTNTVPVADDKRFDSLQVLSIAPLLANAIRAVFEDRSVSELFGGDNV